MRMNQILTLLRLKKQEKKRKELNERGGWRLVKMCLARQLILEKSRTNTSKEQFLVADR